MLTDEVMREIANRITVASDTLAFISPMILEKIYPLRVNGPGQDITPRTWQRLVGRQIKDIKTIATIHYVPGHWCLLVIDMDQHRIYYYDSYYESPYADEAASKFRRYLRDERRRQGQQELSDTFDDHNDFHLIKNSGLTTATSWCQLWHLLPPHDQVPC